MAEDYALHREIVQNGFVDLYDKLLPGDPAELPSEIAAHVRDILAMHAGLLWSLDGQPDREAMLDKVKFFGFDANNEIEHLSFARFLTTKMDYYKDISVFNSHHPTLDRYNRMLKKWNEFEKQQQLSRPQVEAILEAGKPAQIQV